MKLRLILLIIFNMIDVYCTIYLVDHGGIELNPIGRWLLQWPMALIWAKLLVPSLFAICAWKLREYKLAHIITWIAFTPYCILATYYILLFIFFL